MNIITQNRGNIQTLSVLAISKSQYTVQFFSNLREQSLAQRTTVTNLLIMLRESLTNNSITTPFKSCAQLLTARGVRPNNVKYQESFILLKKLGLILKHNNRYLLNPLVRYKATARSYELAVEYYNILFADLVLDSDAFPFGLQTIDELKNGAISDYILKFVEQNKLIDLNNYAYTTYGDGEYIEPIKIKSNEEYRAIYDKAPKSLDSNDKALWNGIDTTYRNICNDYITNLVVAHMYIFQEQGVVDIKWAENKYDKTHFKFNKATVQFQKTLIPYYKTEAYLNNLRNSKTDAELATQLFSDIKDELQQQYEDEAFEEFAGNQEEHTTTQTPIMSEYTYAQRLHQETYDYAVLMARLYPDEFEAPTKTQKASCTSISKVNSTLHEDEKQLQEIKPKIHYSKDGVELSF